MMSLKVVEPVDGGAVHSIVVVVIMAVVVKVVVEVVVVVAGHHAGPHVISPYDIVLLYG